MSSSAIIESARAGSDAVAERIATLGVAADGRVASIERDTELEPFPEGRHAVEETVTLVADRLAAVAACLRRELSEVGEVDPVTQDRLIGIFGEIEKHLWMVQSQELSE